LKTKANAKFGLAFEPKVKLAFGLNMIDAPPAGWGRLSLTDCFMTI